MDARTIDGDARVPRREVGLRRDSKAQAEQVRTIDAGRIGEQVGKVPRTRMRQIDDALRLHLNL